MKTMIASALLAVFASSASANNGILAKRVVCANEQIIKNILLETGQEMLFYGDTVDDFFLPGNNEYSSYQNVSSVWVNQNTGIWSLLLVSEDETHCIVTVGQNFEPYTGPTLRQMESIEWNE